MSASTAIIRLYLR